MRAIYDVFMFFGALAACIAAYVTIRMFVTDRKDRKRASFVVKVDFPPWLNFASRRLIVIRNTGRHTASGFRVSIQGEPYENCVAKGWSKGPQSLRDEIEPGGETMITWELSEDARGILAFELGWTDGEGHRTMRMDVPT